GVCGSEAARKPTALSGTGREHTELKNSMLPNGAQWGLWERSGQKAHCVKRYRKGAYGTQNRRKRDDFEKN
ncbi:MAG: hypothetical protein K2P87_14255, partial [Lachnospiraceae bacterium]|nr:hypothetical protein [Lachnospiraceae bacterium]